MQERIGPLSGVYFIQCQSFVKIGISVNVERRYGSIKNANPYPIRPLGFIKVVSPEEMQCMEVALHDLFKSSHHRGEWFRDSEELRVYIASVAAEWPQMTQWDWDHGTFPLLNVEQKQAS